MIKTEPHCSSGVLGQVPSLTKYFDSTQERFDCDFIKTIIETRERLNVHPEHV